MMLMATYGTLEISGNERKNRLNGNTVQFEYPEIFLNHSIYQHSVGNHNNLRQSPILIENTWATSYWPNCIFVLLIEVIEVNIVLSLTNIYGHEPIEAIEFQKKLAKALLNNT